MRYLVLYAVPVLVTMGCGRLDCTPSGTTCSTDPSTVDLGGAVPVFTREGGTDENMEMFSVMKIDESEGDDYCRLENKGYGGQDVWNLTFPTDAIPLTITYGELPDGATEDAPAVGLVEGAVYQALWGDCTCWDLWWTQGDSSATRTDSC